MSRHSSKGPEWDAKRAVVIARYEGMCANCQTEGANHVDHIIPKSLHGTDDLDNLQLLCEQCNTKKGARMGGSRATWFSPNWFKATKQDILKAQ